MNAPCTCTGCQIGRACRQGDRDHRPETGMEYALAETRSAITAMEAATKRLHEALGNLAAAQVIHKSQQP
jgi:hypothetical protein